MPRRGMLVAAAAATACGGLLAVGTPAVQASADRPAVVEARIIGYTVMHRPIRAWRVGDPDAGVTAAALAVLHGDERAPRKILATIRDGRPVHGVDLWLLPAVNPDGYARNSRDNAHGVDLNRNFPRAWLPQDGLVESGPRPASEPETRAVMRFMVEVDPRLVVSFHQPLHAVDSSGDKSPSFTRRLADVFGLPLRQLDCGGGCHGTFTQWFNHRFPGAAVTVELGRRPSWRRLHVTGPRELLRAIGGRR